MALQDHLVSARQRKASLLGLTGRVQSDALCGRALTRRSWSVMWWGEGQQSHAVVEIRKLSHILPRGSANAPYTLTELYRSFAYARGWVGLGAR